MGKILHLSGSKVLRYGNFTNSITKSYDNSVKESYIKQTFGSYTYELLKIHAGDSINRTSYMTYENMNATHYYGPYNLKLHSTRYGSQRDTLSPARPLPAPKGIRRPSTPWGNHYNPWIKFYCLRLQCKPPPGCWDPWSACPQEEKLP